MLVTKQYQIDLAPKSGSRNAMYPPMEAVQGDTDTHAVALVLNEGGSVWYPPDGASAMVGYVRSDGAGGTYDTLSDGSAVCSIDGNVITAVIPASALALSGPVQFAVYLVYHEEKLHIFDTIISVRRNPLMFS